MASGEVSAARTTISEVPRLRVLVAVGMSVSWKAQYERKLRYLRWRLSSAAARWRPAGRCRGFSGPELRRRRARLRMGCLPFLVTVVRLWAEQYSVTSIDCSEDKPRVPCVSSPSACSCCGMEEEERSQLAVVLKKKLIAELGDYLRRSNAKLQFL